jgi:predicted Zn-dependent protease
LWLLDDSTVNAASFGGGRFVAWAGMETLSDQDVDAVFAHEVAHDALRHSQKASELKDVTDFFGEVLGTLTGSDRAATNTLQRWSGAFVVPAYSRSQEFEADSAAVLYLALGGYPNPHQVLCGALGRLRDRVGESGGGFFSSHPALTDRLARLHQEAVGIGEAESCQ